MRSRKLVYGAAGLALLALLVAPASATKVKHMNLADLTNNAGTIVRGTVVDIEGGTVAVGGGELPTVTYVLAVKETLKGEAATKVRITMVTNPKEQTRSGDYVRLARLPEMPKLAKGQQYLLFGTTPSRVGLSTTVGLGQGAFRVYSDAAKSEVAVNELGNAGLFRGMEVPAGLSTEAGMDHLTYSDLRSLVRDLAGN